MSTVVVSYVLNQVGSLGYPPVFSELSDTGTKVSDSSRYWAHLTTADPDAWIALNGSLFDMRKETRDVFAERDALNKISQPDPVLYDKLVQVLINKGIIKKEDLGDTTSFDERITAQTTLDTLESLKGT